MINIITTGNMSVIFVYFIPLPHFPFVSLYYFLSFPLFLSSFYCRWYSCSPSYSPSVLPFRFLFVMLILFSSLHFHSRVSFVFIFLYTYIFPCVIVSTTYYSINLLPPDHQVTYSFPGLWGERRGEGWGRGGRNLWTPHYFFPIYRANPRWRSTTWIIWSLEGEGQRIAVRGPLIHLSYTAEIMTSY